MWPSGHLIDVIYMDIAAWFSGVYEVMLHKVTHLCHLTSRRRWKWCLLQHLRVKCVVRCCYCNASCFRFQNFGVLSHRRGFDIFVCACTRDAPVSFETANSSTIGDEKVGYWKITSSPPYLLHLYFRPSPRMRFVENIVNTNLSCLLILKHICFDDCFSDQLFWRLIDKKKLALSADFFN